MALAATAVVLLGAPASAHAELESSDPPAGARLASAPTHITLTFTEPVDTPGDAVRLFDRRGDRVKVSDVRRVDEVTVTAALPGLSDGSYVATWRVTSDDGHPIRGAFTFAVGKAPSAVPEGLAERLLASQDGSTSVGAAYTLARYLSFAATLVLLGAVAFVVFTGRSPGGDDLRRWLLGAAALALVAALAGTVLQPLHAAGRPLGDAFRGDVWSEAFDTRVGRAWVARGLLLLAFVPLVLVGSGPGRRGVWRALAGAVLGAALILTFPFAGHATTGRWVAVGVVADVVHLAAVALWLGGLTVVLLVLRGPRSDEALPGVVPRFSSLALVAVVAIVASGVVQAWRQVGALEALRETDYGRLLLFKVVLVVVVVVIASTSRDLVRRRLAEAPVRKLRRNVAVEVAYAAVVLGVTALLVNAAPPRGELSRPFTEIVRAGDVSFDVLLSPAQTGRNELHVTVLAPDGLAVPTEEIVVAFREPERDIVAIEVPMRPVGTGHFVGSGVDLPIRGEWVLDVEAQPVDGDVARASVGIRVE